MGGGDASFIRNLEEQIRNERASRDDVEKKYR